MAILPSEHAARLLEYYIRSLVERSGLKWTEANTADFDRLAQLLDQVEAVPELDSIPPFHHDTPPIRSDRTTQIFERDSNDAIPDPAFQRWRGQQRYTEDDDVRRIVTRR